MLSAVDMVAQRRDCPHQLCDNDDDDGIGNNIDVDTVDVDCRYGGELLPKLIPSLAGLSTNLENLEWLVNLNSSVADLVHLSISCALRVLTVTHPGCFE